MTAAILVLQPTASGPSSLAALNTLQPWLCRSVLLVRIRWVVDAIMSYRLQQGSLGTLPLIQPWRKPSPWKLDGAAGGALPPWGNYALTDVFSHLPSHYQGMVVQSLAADW